MAVLEGQQGIRKSTLVAALSPFPEWAGICSSDLRDYPRFVDDLRGKLVVEFPEMVHSKSDANRVKALITCAVDNVRLSYDKRSRRFARRCVFIGTTNEAHYLNDRTGNRRFLPVAVKQCDVDGLVAVRAQLWAEAFDRVRAGEALILRDAVAATASEHQSARLEDNPYLQPLFDALRGRGWPDDVGNAAEVAQAYLAIPPERVNKNVQNLVGAALAELGYKRDLRYRMGARRRTFVKEAEWAPPDLLD